MQVKNPLNFIRVTICGGQDDHSVPKLESTAISSTPGPMSKRNLLDITGNAELKFFSWHGNNREQLEKENLRKDDYHDFQEEILPDSESEMTFDIKNNIPKTSDHDKINLIDPPPESESLFFPARQVAAKFAEELLESTGQGVPLDVLFQDIVDTIEASVEEDNTSKKFYKDVLSELINIVSENLESDRILENAVAESDRNFQDWYEPEKDSPIRLEDKLVSDFQSKVRMRIMRLSYVESLSEEDREKYRDSINEFIQRENQKKQDVIESAENNFKQWYLISEEDDTEFEAYLPRVPVTVSETSLQTDDSITIQNEDDDSFDEFLEREEMPEGFFSDED